MIVSSEEFDLLTYAGKPPNIGTVVCEEDELTRWVRVYDKDMLVLEFRMDVDQWGIWHNITSNGITLPWECETRPFLKPLIKALQWLEEWETE